MRHYNSTVIAHDRHILTPKNEGPGMLHEPASRDSSTRSSSDCDWPQWLCGKIQTPSHVSPNVRHKKRDDIPLLPFLFCFVGARFLRSDVRAPSNGPFCMTPGGTRYQDGVTRPLVDRVAELEEKLVNCSMENATAKQDYLTVKLRNSQLEKNTQRLRHELAKSRAMNDLLQNEVQYVIEELCAWGVGIFAFYTSLRR